MTPASEAIIAATILREGGLQNHPADADGPLSTNWGITAGFYAEFLGIPVAQVTEGMMRAIDKARAAQLYRWHMGRHNLEAIADPTLRELIFDFTVNSNPLVGIRALHRAVGLTPGSIIGSATIAKLSALNPEGWLRVWLKVWVERERYYAGLTARKTGHPFIVGWINRNTVLLLDRFAAKS